MEKKMNFTHEIENMNGIYQIYLALFLQLN